MARRRKRNSKLDSILFVIGLICVACVKVYEWVMSLPTLTLVLVGVGFVTVTTLIVGWRASVEKAKRLAFEKAMDVNEFSDDVEDYWVRQSNFKRRNRVEKRFRKKFLLHLLDLFDNTGEHTFGCMSSDT